MSAVSIVAGGRQVRGAVERVRRYSACTSSGSGGVCASLASVSRLYLVEG